MQIHILTRNSAESEKPEAGIFEPANAADIYKLLNELRYLRLSIQNTRFESLAMLAWEDENNQTADLNMARLRAKYYGAEYIISRPFLHHIVSPNEKPEKEALKKDALEKAGRFAATLPPDQFDIFKRPPYIPEDVDERALRTIFGAKKCIAAALNSTYAFDKVEGRLKITNVFGTMHA